MTNEPIMIWQFLVAMLGLTVGSTLYSLGGYKGKFWRRFVGSFILSLTFNGLCLWRGLWSPWLLFSFPVLIGAFILPYGADTTFPKLVKRSCVVLASLIAGLIFCLINGGNSWGIFYLEIGISVWSIYLGIKNPLFARAEEGFICILLCLALMMYPFISLNLP